MIGKLTGQLINKQLPSILIELANGIAYELEVSMHTSYKLPELGQKIALYTHQVIREDAHLLYGFYDLPERALFRALIKANGVGPKLALTILSNFDPNQFIFCVQQNDSASLVRVPGIGKKTAERLLIELRDKLTAQPLLNSAASITAPADQSAVLATNSDVKITEQPRIAPMQEAQSALVALGYKPQEASRMLAQLSTEQLTELSCEQMIKLALQGVST